MTRNSSRPDFQYCRASFDIQISGSLVSALARRRQQRCKAEAVGRPTPPAQVSLRIKTSHERQNQSTRGMRRIRRRSEAGRSCRRAKTLHTVGNVDDEPELRLRN